MNQKIIKTIIILIWAASCQLYAQDIDIANAYMKQGEYDKAIELFKKVVTNKDQARVVHNDYLIALYKVKDFMSAEKFLKTQIKNNDNNVSYKADFAQFLDISGKTDLASKEFTNLINSSAGNDNALYELQNFFFRTNRLELASQLLLTSRTKMNDPYRHDLQLARVYAYLDKKDKMLEEVLGYGYRNRNYTYVQTTIQDNIKDEKEIEMLEKLLYDKVQAEPNESYYAEILIWHFTQKLDYARAFIQARALDKRLKLNGIKMFEIAGQAFTSKDYKNSAKFYQYIMTEYPEGELYPYAKRWLIQSKEEIIKNSFPIDNQNIIDLIDQYKSLIAELGVNNKTIDALRNLALLQGFYLGEHDIAIQTLNEAITKAANNQKFRDQCKLDLGDIYILKNEPWESTLLYMQVEKSQKEDNLAEIAKLKNAKLQYYTGQFELSKEILDVLKKATTKEISNDALQLSLLIQDNTGLDTSELAMQEFSNVDLLIFQNKYQESSTELSRLFQKYKTHSLADEILWLKANINLKINRLDEAIEDLNNIMNNYKFDILADDAIFLLAQVQQDNKKDKVKAMELYKKILNDYPGSIYGAQSRIKFRELRGDFVN